MFFFFFMIEFLRVVQRTELFEFFSQMEHSNFTLSSSTFSFPTSARLKMPISKAVASLSSFWSTKQLAPNHLILHIVQITKGGWEKWNLVSGRRFPGGGWALWMTGKVREWRVMNLVRGICWWPFFYLAFSFSLHFINIYKA